MKAYKFLIPVGKPVRLAPEDQTNGTGFFEIEGCVSVAIANSQQEALELLTRVAQEAGQDARWLKVATVIELPIDRPCRLCWVML
jgi:hypothetical protein